MYESLSFIFYLIKIFLFLIVTVVFSFLRLFIYIDHLSSFIFKHILFLYNTVALLPFIFFHFQTYFFSSHHTVAWRPVTQDPHNSQLLWRLARAEYDLSFETVSYVYISFMVLSLPLPFTHTHNITQNKTKQNKPKTMNQRTNETNTKNNSKKKKEQRRYKKKR